MLSSVEGKETLVRRLFNANAALPTDVTPSGTVKEVSALQLANASPPVASVLAGRSSVVCLSLWRPPRFPLVRYVSVARSLNTTSVMLDSIKAPSAIVVILLPIVIFDRFPFPENTPAPISTTVSGKT